MPPTASTKRTPESKRRPEPAGYSGSSQRKKLGLHAGSTYLLWNAPIDWTFEDSVTDARRIENVNTGETIDIVIAFALAPEHVATIGSDLAPLIFPNGSLWIAWPRKAAGHRSEVTEGFLRDILLPLGIVDTKVAAIDRDWSGLRFVWRKELRRHLSADGASAAHGETAGC